MKPFCYYLRLKNAVTGEWCDSYSTKNVTAARIRLKRILKSGTYSAGQVVAYHGPHAAVRLVHEVTATDFAGFNVNWSQVA